MKTFRGGKRVATLAIGTLWTLTGIASSAAPPTQHHASRPDGTRSLETGTKIDAILAAAIKSAPGSEQWPNNNYARLLDLGEVTVKSDGTTVARYRETYKLFNQRARELAEVTLPYNSSYQELRVVSARTIKKDGTVVNVNPDDIREGSIKGDFLLYDDAKGLNFSMPAVEDDCVIDYTYEMITHPLMMAGQFTAYWGFTGPEPVAQCQYILHVPTDKPVRYKVYNDDTLQPQIATSPDGHTRTYTWERRNLAPMEFEPMMPPIQDSRVWMEVSSLGSWQDIAHWFWDLQQPQAKPTDAIRATVAKLIANKKSDDDKARSIYDWVANRTRYVGLEFGLSAYRPHPASDVHDKLYGDCKDKANLLITMLGIAGIKAHPVLLNAEDKRAPETGLPTLNAFNHCISLAEVNGKERWLDATAETCAYGDIPEGDRGAHAFVVRDGVGKFQTIPTYAPEENGVDITAKIALKPDGSADTAAEITMRGGAGQGMREAIRSLTPDQRKEAAQRLAQTFSTVGKMKEFAMGDADSKEGPYTLKLTLRADSYGRKTGSLLLVPLGVGLGSGTRHSPFTKDKRLWPIVQEESALAKSAAVLSLPDGFQIEDVPADVDLVSPLHEYHRKLVKSEDGKSFTLLERFVERPGRVPVSDYNKEKGFYEELLKTNDDQIVLKKVAAQTGK